MEARLLEGRGRVLVDLGRNDEAEQPLQRARFLFETYRGERHLWTGRAWYGLALAAYASGGFAEAEARIAQSLDILSNMLDQTNPFRADALSLQGAILQAKGDLDPAEQSLSAAIATYRQAYGGPHYNIGIAQFYRA
jgi:tetratricopeptide (TPR) repeat protein